LELLGLGLDPQSESVYRAMLRQGNWGVPELAGPLDLTGPEGRRPLTRLAELSLARQSGDDPAQWSPIDPTLALGTLLSRQEAELARRQRAVELSRSAMTELLADYTQAGGAEPDRELQRLQGLTEVRLRLEQVAQQVETEIMSFAPGGPQPAHILDSSRHLDAQVLARGVTMRTIFLDSVRNDAPSGAYSRWLTDLGGQGRPVGTLPPRMVITDRSLAIVPLDPGDASRGAAVVTAPGVVAALCALFEQTWEKAVPLGSAPRRDEAGLSATERTVIRLLNTGLTDEGAARQLGVSLRTVRRVMTDLMARMQVRSRFQLAHLAGAQGWLEGPGRGRPGQDG